MSRLQTAFVLGYHGCERAVGEAVLAGKTGLTASEQKYDWLGPGIYFWEADPVRAREWAVEKARHGKLTEPFVIGAVIDLGNCLDMMSRESLNLLTLAYQSLRDTHDADPSLGPLPENRRAHDGDGDRLLRFLDCAVIRRLHASIDSTPQRFDSVRGLFSEGADLFPGSGFKQKTHIQIAVRNITSIKGYFRVGP